MSQDQNVGEIQTALTIAKLREHKGSIDCLLEAVRSDADYILVVVEHQGGGVRPASISGSACTVAHIVAAALILSALDRHKGEGPIDPDHVADIETRLTDGLKGRGAMTLMDLATAIMQSAVEVGTDDVREMLYGNWRATPPHRDGIH